MPEQSSYTPSDRSQRRAHVARICYAVAALCVMGCQGDRAPATAPASTAPASTALASTAPASTAPGIDIDDPTTCEACHAAVYAEWRESMHSRSHHAEDPIFAALRTLRMQKQGAAVADKCGLCHSPRAPTAVDSPAARAGVSCAACHAVAAVGPGKGAKALRYDPDGVLRGARDLAAGASPAHQIGPALPAMQDGRTLCLACHGELANPAGVPMCTTGAEAGEVSCVGCHMASAPGPGVLGGARATHASHQFAGPHRAWLQDDPRMLASAVDVAVEARPGGVSVTLKNISGHAFPTGFPGRMAVVQIEGLDAAGAVLWRSQPGHADGVLNTVYADAAGKVVLPPFSVKRVRDARLKPGEVRVIQFAPPAPGAQRVRVSLAYQLVPPPAVAVLGLSGAPEGQPRVFHTTVVPVAQP